MPEESEVTIPPRAAALWRNRRFTRLFWAHAISLFGASLTAVALGLLAHDLVGANVSEVLGVTLTIRIAVVVLLAPFAGALAGWAGAKPTLLAADLFRAAIVLGFFLAETVWQIYLLAFLLNIASAIFTPVYKATIPNVVDPRQYPRALSFGTVAYDLANIAGPACAGFLIYWFGYRGNFIAHSVAFLISAVLILFIRFPARATLRPAGRSAERLPGVKAIFQRPPLLHALVLALKVSVGGGFVLVATVHLIKNELQLSDSAYAWAMMAYGIGSTAGALAFGQPEGPAIRAWIYAVFSRTIPPALLAVAVLPRFDVLLVAWLLAGAGQSVLGLRGNELLAENSEPSERGHIYAAHFSLSHIGWGLTYPLAGWTASALGFSRAALLFTVLFLFVAAIEFVYRRSSRMRSHGGT